MTRSAARLLARAKESNRSLSDVWADLQDLGQEVDFGPGDGSRDADEGFESDQ